MLAPAVEIYLLSYSFYRQIYKIRVSQHKKGDHPPDDGVYDQGALLFFLRSFINSDPGSAKRQQGEKAKDSEIDRQGFGL